MSVRYENFLPEVLPHMPECTDIVAVNAIRNACIEFCDRSLYWVYECNPISTTTGQATYDLDVPDFTQPVTIFDAWHNELPLQAKSEEQLRKMYAFDWRDIDGNPRYITMLYPSQVRVVPTPAMDYPDALKLIVALKPTRDSYDIDDEIYERWAEAISLGARARLYSLTGQTFYDPAMAAQTRQMFLAEVAMAASQRIRGLTRGPIFVRPPRAV